MPFRIFSCVLQMVQQQCPPCLPPQITPGTSYTQVRPFVTPSAVHPLIYRVMPKAESLKKYWNPDEGKAAVIDVPHFDQQGIPLSRKQVLQHTKFTQSVSTPQGTVVFQSSDYTPFVEFTPSSAHPNKMWDRFSRIPAGAWHLKVRTKYEK